MRFKILYVIRKWCKLVETHRECLYNTRSTLVHIQKKLYHSMTVSVVLQDKMTTQNYTYLDCTVRFERYKNKFDLGLMKTF